MKSFKVYKSLKIKQSQPWETNNSWGNKTKQNFLVEDRFTFPSLSVRICKFDFFATKQRKENLVVYQKYERTTGITATSAIFTILGYKYTLLPIWLILNYSIIFWSLNLKLYAPKRCNFRSVKLYDSLGDHNAWI